MENSFATQWFSTLVMISSHLEDLVKYMEKKVLLCGVQNSVIMADFLI